MRDLLLTAIVAGLLPAILWRPHLGAYGWAWLSLMNPHRAAWGFAAALPFAQMIAVATLLATLFSRKRHAFPWSPVTVVYVLFLLWMTFTCLFAMNTPEVVREKWLFVVKIHVMVFVTLMLLRGRMQIDTLVWVVTLSLAFYGIKGGVFTALTGGGYRVWGPTYSMVEGNNELAVALVMLVPFMFYLLQTAQRRAVRWFLVFAIGTCSLSILGSHSRGALLALAAMFIVLALKGKRPLIMGAVLGALLVGAVAFMPDQWTDRMETIGTYEQDSSAMARVYTWRTIWNLALDRPITGAGFDTANDAVFDRYPPYREIASDSPVAHSIYFQALGEHGFPGLALYLLLGLLTWRRAGRLIRETRGDPEFGGWVPALMRAAQVSLIGFAVGGAFLTLVHFDLSYYIVSFVLLADATVREQRRAKAVVPALSMPGELKGATK